MASSTTASQSELKANRVPIHWRDGCSALLLPLNVCRKKNYYLSWECDHERHEYERYVFPCYVRRMKELAKKKAEAADL
ncbi:hypothetical protein P691DRAFT_678772 [Macrolepiota fuliginosa MF-IS2]|uniref:NADH dehydrogenase [ubiquinone] 1 beta subcomplex subunit 7 n=1 Tax=Macrolepiota fuliginosa MF-IS2 TaxID=1400762 RepID=A0A9P5X5M1_9AGAR|nr:hypothetical protein P691DRAFT_678772 [Macrolepiota fuliginosa MF-IS2]